MLQPAGCMQEVMYVAIDKASGTMADWQYLVLFHFYK